MICELAWGIATSTFVDDIAHCSITEQILCNAPINSIFVLRQAQKPILPWWTNLSSRLHFASTIDINIATSLSRSSHFDFYLVHIERHLPPMVLGLLPNPSLGLVKEGRNKYKMKMVLRWPPFIDQTASRTCLDLHLMVGLGRCQGTEARDPCEDRIHIQHSSDGE